MNKITRMSIAAIFVSVLCLQGCKPGIETYGEAPDSSAVRTAIGTVLLNPQDYIGKEVVLEGTMVSQCPSGCFFYLRDTSDATMYIELKGSSFGMIPQRPGADVAVKGTVFQTSGEPKEIQLFAKGLTVMPAGSASKRR